ncbi:hypothetical protein ACFOW4_12805 [Micromonospora sp. GCM10011542]|uniref:hypothetical protein n=1 Tax=Micromonospora sp. GCM10011542 TaxID=3317337 RepID=UPI00360A16BA
MMDASTPQWARKASGLRRVLVVLLPVLAGALAVGVFTGGRDTGIFDGDPPTWASVLGGILVLAGLGLETAVIGSASRS